MSRNNVLKMPAETPEIQKSTRHSKITGDFSESLVLYWLSKHGFECARVDHTGIDLIAKHPQRSERMGISVKSRSRTPGLEKSSVRIDKDHVTKCEEACANFGCIPYFAVVVDGDKKIEAFIAPKDRFLKYATTSGRKSYSWKMRAAWKEKYEADPRVVCFQMTYSFGNWFND
jgi:Holliday junction resolvase-like predicted endonuclease